MNTKLGIFAINRYSNLRFCCGMLIALVLAVLNTALAQAATSLGTTELLEGTTAGTDSVVLAVTPETDMWTASSNDTWLHLSVANQSGEGSTNVVFSYDANLGGTRTGTLTIAGQTLSVTQAGSTYIAAPAPVTTLVASGLSYPFCVAVDKFGNVYFANSGNNEVKKWTAANNTVSTLFSMGVNGFNGVAVDSSGDVYIIDNVNSAIRKWTAANGSLTTLVSGLINPSSMALDGAGNVYIADIGDNTIKKWTATDNALTTLISSGLNSPWGIAVDRAGNLYTADSGTIKKWTAANNTMSPLISSGVSSPAGLAVDGSGNIYVTDISNNSIKKWTAASNTVTTLVASGLNRPYGVAVDSTGNIYIADSFNNAIKELPRCFVDPTGKEELPSPGSDVLPLVLPTATSLLAPFAPTSDQPWLTINSVSGGAVKFNFEGNIGQNRLANIAFLGQTIPILQHGSGFSYSLGVTALLEAPTGGSDSVALLSQFATWTASANDAWLHLSAANQSGMGSTNVVFTCDANPGLTRTGTLTIAGLTLTVTQAGSGYVSTPAAVTPLVSSGLHYPCGVAVDGAGNVYIADSANNAIKRWTPTNNTVTTLIDSGLSSPASLAVDRAGNVYIADTGNKAIKQWAVASNTLNTLVASGLTSPFCVAVDGEGNVYIADNDNGSSSIKKWTPASNTLTPFNASGYYGGPVAVDWVGNVYFVSNSAIQEWSVANNTVSTLGTVGLYSPIGMAVDGSGNVYVADRDFMVIKKWTAGNNTVSTLVSFRLNAMYGGLAVDGAENIYFPYFSGIDYALCEVPHAFVDRTVKSEGADAGSDVLLPVLPASENLLPPFAPTSDQPWLTITGVSNGIVSFAFSASLSNRTAHIALLGQSISINQGPLCSLSTYALPEGSAAGSDGVALTVIPEAGIWTATANAPWLHLSVQSGTGSSNVVFSYDANPGAARTGTLIIGGQTLTVTQAPPPYFLGTFALLEGAAAGSDSVFLTVTQETGTWTATANASWLHLSASNQSGTGSTTFVFSYDANLLGTRIGTITIAGQTLTVTQQGLYSLGTAAIVEGPAAGSDSVVLGISPESNVWTATADATWLHLTAANQNGTGSTNVVFSYDVNSGATRTGTLTIAGQVLTVTQAGSSYIPVPGLVTTLVSKLHSPGVAVDGAGNVYIADTGNNAIKEWKAANNTVTTLVSLGSSTPYALAVDSAGNVYFTVYNGESLIQKWTATNNAVTTLVSSGLNLPYGVAVDGAGNVYIADTFHNMIKKWTATNNTVTALVSSGLSYPSGVTVDGAGNVYIADSYHNMIKRWTPANNTVTTLVSSGLSNPSGVAVDGAGNVYIGDSNNNAVKKWTATSNAVTSVIASGLSHPFGVAVDGAGNVYVADVSNNAIKELPHAFVDPTPKREGPGAGSDVLPVVLPATANLLVPFLPTTDQPWLNLSGITNGMVSFAFSATASNRTANITLLGQSILLTQHAPPALGTTALLEGPEAGTDSVVLAMIGTWSAAVDAPWLHLSADNQGGRDGTNVVFSFDANPGATRTGTLSVAGQMLTITQAGSTYTPAFGLLSSPSSFALNHPFGVATDAAGNVYIADTYHNAIKKWTIANNTVTTLIDSGLSYPQQVAVDGAGNVYIADTYHNAIKKWTAASNTVTPLVASGLSGPFGVAVDADGNVFIADTGNNAVKKWTAGNSTVRTLVSSGVVSPSGVAVDGAGNVYIADTYHNAVKVWNEANNSLNTLPVSGLSQPRCVAVDGAGNVYVTDTLHSAIKKWTAANNAVSTLIATGLNSPFGVTVDSPGNIYVADTWNDTIRELPHVFVDSTLKLETPAAASDVLPIVLPSSANLFAPFLPSSDQPWLTMGGSINGVVSFAFTANSGPVRTANITLFGQTIPVTQAAAPTLVSATVMGNGAFQFAFTNTSLTTTFTVLTATNLSLPMNNWTVVGSATNTAPGLFQFTAPSSAHDLQRFYRISSP